MNYKYVICGSAADFYLTAYKDIIRDKGIVYHKTVVELRKEIDRLNGRIEEYQQIEQKYNHLLSSRKLQLLKKIKFIEF